jgi:hypothetical protein
MQSGRGSCGTLSEAARWMAWGGISASAVLGGVHCTTVQLLRGGNWAV